MRYSYAQHMCTLRYSLHAIPNENLVSGIILYIHFLFISHANQFIIFLAEKPHFIKMPQDATIHDYADFDTKARAEGILYLLSSILGN